VFFNYLCFIIGHFIFSYTVVYLNKTLQSNHFQKSSNDKVVRDY